MAKHKFYSRQRKNLWYRSDPIGSQEELTEAFEVMSKYLYKLLDYAEKEEPIPQEELDKERRIFTFCMNGPKAGHFRLSKRGKLTSPDVIYILSSSLPSRILAEKFNINQRKVREIRSGDAEEWTWEYYLIERLKTIIKHRIINDKTGAVKGRIYSISKVVDVDKKEILFYTTSQRKAKEMRKSILTKEEYNRLVDRKEIDIRYPIELIELYT